MNNPFYLPVDETSLGFTAVEIQMLKDVRKTRNGIIRIGNRDYRLYPANNLTVEALDSQNENQSVWKHSGYSDRHTVLEVFANFREWWIARAMQNIRCMVLGILPRYESTANYHRFRFQLSRGYLPIWLAKDYGNDKYFFNFTPIIPDQALEYFESTEPEEQVCIMEYSPDKALDFALKNNITIDPDKILKSKTST